MSGAAPRVAVVGAGVSGLTCARALQSAGVAAVRVFEKSRSYGGRCSSVHWRGSVVDTGVQFFTLKSSFARALVRDELRLVPRGASLAAHEAEVLSGEMRSLPRNGVVSAEDRVPIAIKSGHRMYHLHGNSFFPRSLADGLDICMGATVMDVNVDGRVAFERVGEGGEEESGEEEFDAVVITAPLPQTSQMLPDESPPEWASAFAPNITLLAEYETELLDGNSPARRGKGSIPLYGMYPPRSSILGWTACENAKTGRKMSPGKTVMVMQASDAFSGVNFEKVDQNAGWDARTDGQSGEPTWALDLIGEMEEMWKIRSAARTACFSKRWKYARVVAGSRAKDVSHVESPSDRIFVCGDGVARRSRLEHALLNGHYAAHRVAESLNIRHTIPSWSPC